MLFIVSRSSSSAARSRRMARPNCGIAVSRASGVKCERCWRYVSAMSTDPAQAGICDRCQDALAEAVPS